MSKTAERAWARSTTSRSFSAGRVALDLEGHADAREAVAHLVGEAERAADVHVALERRLDLGQAHLARGRDVDQRRRQARRERVQQRLGRVGAGVDAEQDGRLAGVDGERLRRARCPPARRRRSPGSSSGCARRRSSGCGRGTGRGRATGSALMASSVPYICCGVDAVADAVEDLGHRRSPSGVVGGGARYARWRAAPRMRAATVGAAKRSSRNWRRAMHEQAHRRRRDDGRAALPARAEQPDLAEEVAGPEGADALAVAKDVGRARDDDEELPRVAALPRQLGAGGHADARRPGARRASAAAGGRRRRAGSIRRCSVPWCSAFGQGWDEGRVDQGEPKVRLRPAPRASGDRAVVGLIFGAAALTSADRACGRWALASFVRPAPLRRRWRRVGARLT